MTKQGQQYRAYLQSDGWQVRREGALRRAGHRCQLCNGSERLQVHHRTYERVGNELPEDLTVLCFGCHRRLHQPVLKERLPKAEAKAERRRRIDDLILAALEQYGAMTWDTLRAQITYPNGSRTISKAQAWGRARRLLGQHRIEWTSSGKRLCLAGKRDLFDW